MSSAVLNNTQAGLFNTNSYISSGIPFLTGSLILASEFTTNDAEVRVEFPYVVRSVTIISRAAADIKIHFNSISDGNIVGGRHYVSLTENRDSITFNVKCKEIFVSLVDGASGNGDFELVAELTTIKSREMFTLTGSGLTI